MEQHDIEREVGIAFSWDAFRRKVATRVLWRVPVDFGPPPLMETLRSQDGGRGD